MYLEELAAIINKAMRDEISSAMLYHSVAEKVNGTEMEEFSTQLKENGDEEFNHFKEILAYANNHGIDTFLSVDLVILSKPYTNNIEVDVAMILELEQTAINDYTNAAVLARSVEDLETESFFIELMNDERKHSDGMLKLSKLQKPKMLSFKDFVGI